MTEKQENKFKQLQILEMCHCPCEQELILPSVPLLVLERLCGVWSRSGMNSGFGRTEVGSRKGTVSVSVNSAGLKSAHGDCGW